MSVTSTVCVVPETIMGRMVLGQFEDPAGNPLGLIQDS